MNLYASGKSDMKAKLSYSPNVFSALWTQKFHWTSGVQELKKKKKLKERTKEVFNHSLCWSPWETTPCLLFKLELTFYAKSNDILRNVHSYRTLSRFYDWHCFSELASHLCAKREHCKKEKEVVIHSSLSFQNEMRTSLLISNPKINYS